MTKSELRARFDALAPERDRWIRRARYYHEQLVGVCRSVIPPGASVLDLGCGTGDLLAALRPARGVGIDLSPEMLRIARSKYPHLVFREGDAETIDLDERFDYVVLSDLIGHLSDVQRCFEGLHRVIHRESRVVITYYNFLWEPALKLAEWLGLKMPQQEQNWLGMADIENLLRIAGFEPVRRAYRILLPVRVPVLAPVLNGIISQLPGIRQLCLLEVVVGRPIEGRGELTVSVVVPTRNERGNIQGVIERTPEMGAGTEIIFVDGNSWDGTRDEIERHMRVHRERRIRLLLQEGGEGKGDAVRRGFDAATGDVLMILDADMTVPPEDLPKFYSALSRGTGDFINGSRLVYPMEGQAMRFLNLVANKVFALWFSWLLDQPLKDTLCGTKALLRRDYERIRDRREEFGNSDPFGDFELLFGAARQSLKIVEIPVRYRERTYGASNIRRLRHGWLLLRMCARGYRMFKVV